VKRVWLVGVGAYVLVVLSYHLSVFPGLHFDEAWFGLDALRIRSQGLTSAHGMRAYTGALFPWLLAEVFRASSPGVFTLRLPGVLLNTAGLLILLGSVQRNAGRRSAVLLFLLFGSSLLFLWMSRVAWEVSALQLVLVATMVAAVLDASTRERWTAPGVALFLLASDLGVVNHLIFALVPTSFLAAGLLAGAGRRDPLATERVWIGVLAVGSMCLTLLVKWAVPDAMFTRWQGPIVAAFLAWPLGVARWGRAWPAAFGKWIERTRPQWLLPPLLLSVAAFAAVHGVAFVGGLANVLVMKRIASWAPPLPGSRLGYVWGLTLVGVFATVARDTVQRVRRNEALRTPDFIALWTLASLGALALLVGRQSLRYYILPSALISLAIALALPGYRALARPFTLAAVLAFLAVNGVAWRGILEEANRPPLRFRIGPAHETSAHFLRLDAVVQKLEALGVCRTEAQRFIEQPLAFYRATRPPACGTNGVYRLQYCEHCSPPYISLEPTGRP
jgi:hypothetical protein